mgnify:CR=1 FL=1
MAGNCSRYIRAAQLLNEFEIGQARHEIDELFWSDFCDFYIEIAKERGHVTKGMIIKKDAKRITVNRSNSDHNYWAARYTYTVAGKEYCRKFSCSPLSSTRSHLRTIINVYWIDDPARPFWDYSEDPLGDLYNIFTTLFPWIVAILLILFLPGGADAVRQYQIPTISG